METSELPLFPLSSVLFPGGILKLRLFEPRYLDLVKRCGRSGEGFGICLILDGREAGAPARRRRRRRSAPRRPSWISP